MFPRLYGLRQPDDCPPSRDVELASAVAPDAVQAILGGVDSNGAMGYHREISATFGARMATPRTI